MTFRHIHNSITEGRLRGICASMGMSLPALCRLFDAMEREQQKYADRLVYHVPRPAPKIEDATVLREEPPSKPDGAQ